MIERLFAPTDGATHVRVIPLLLLLTARGEVGAEGVVTGVAVTGDEAAVQPLEL